MIFVFGSNLAGVHGAGAALCARREHGAVYGEGEGHFGNSYAIPTKDMLIQTLPLCTIRQHVQTFLKYARENMHFQFRVTPIGCGLAGYTPEQIAPMFLSASYNCHFDERLQEVLDRLLEQDARP